MRTTKQDGTTYGGFEKRTGVHGKKFIPTDEERERVIKLVQCGSPVHFIASELKISIPTVQKAFSSELENAFWMAHEKIVGSLQEAAEKGNLDAIKFWLSRHPQLKKKWSEKTQIETEEGSMIDSIKVVFLPKPNEGENGSKK